MERKIQLLFICIIFYIPLWGQLTSNLNSLRIGDEIIKQQVQYKNPGKSGSNIFWDFHELIPTNPGYSLDYALPVIVDDSLYVMGRDTLTLDKTPIIATEHYTMYYYLLHNDSLLQLGHENPNTQLQYIKPMLSMKYPFNYGDVWVSDYESKGLYSGTVDIHTKGTIRIEADAFGEMVIPHGDTLTVMRVKTTQLITELNDQNDSINNYTNRVMETFRWYSKGYRYPIFESIRSIELGDNIAQFNTSFYFPPQEHYYLDNDPENVAVLDSLWNLKDFLPDDDYNPANNNIPVIKCNIYPNPVQDILNLNIELYESTPFTILLFSMNGNILQTIRKNELPAGVYFETMDLSGLPAGNYLIKIISSDDSIFTQKITKL